MNSLQNELNMARGTLKLTPGEYEGPIVVDKPVVIDGCDSTIWANSGPVVVVTSASVTLKNLRIEITGAGGSGEEGVSLKLVAPDTALEHIEVSGRVMGLQEESANWKASSVIALGEFAANTENSFSVEFESPAPAKIVHSIKGVEIEPLKLKQGKNKLRISTAGMRENTILFGELLLNTRVSRRIYLTGKSVKGAPEYHAEKIIAGNLPISTPIQMDPPDDVIAPVVSEDNSVMIVSRGQRLPVKDLEQRELKVVYEHASAVRSIDIDPYVFLLAKNGKARSDEDLIFFGNTTTADNSVRVNTQDVPAVVTVELSRINPEIEKIVVVYSIYDEQNSGDFSCVRNPVIRVLSNDREKYRMNLDNLTTEKTIVAMELYRYKGEWKINFAGGGYISGLPRLCNDYGISVE